MDSDLRTSEMIQNNLTLEHEIYQTQRKLAGLKEALRNQN